MGDSSVLYHSFTFPFSAFGSACGRSRCRHSSTTSSLYSCHQSLFPQPILTPPPSFIVPFLNCKYKNVQMLPFDGVGHSWRFSDVCRVTQLWLKAFSREKIKEVCGAGRGGTGTPAALLWWRLQISGGADSTPTCTTPQVTGEAEETRSLTKPVLQQIDPDSDYINPRVGIDIGLITAGRWQTQRISPFLFDHRRRSTDTAGCAEAHSTAWV